MHVKQETSNANEIPSHEIHGVHGECITIKKEQWFHTDDTFVMLVLRGDPGKKMTGIQESWNPTRTTRSLATELPPPSYGTSVPQIRQMITPQKLQRIWYPKKWPRILKP